jgi:hypothetical protein
MRNCLIVFKLDKVERKKALANLKIMRVEISSCSSSTLYPKGTGYRTYIKKMRRRLIR